MASSSLLSSGDPLCLAGKATADSVRHPAQARLGGPDGQRAGWLAGAGWPEEAPLGAEQPADMVGAGGVW